MTMFLQAEEGPPVEVATNTGWGLFSKAARRRKAGTELIGLVDEGISEDPAALRQDLKALLKAVPDQNLVGIARSVLDFLEGQPRLVMTSDGRELDVGGEEPTGPDEDQEPTNQELTLSTLEPTTDPVRPQVQGLLDRLGGKADA